MLQNKASVIMLYTSVTRYKKPRSVFASLIHYTTYALHHFLGARAADLIINHFYSLQPLISSTLKCCTLLSSKLPCISILQMYGRHSFYKHTRLLCPLSLDLTPFDVVPLSSIPYDFMFAAKSLNSSPHFCLLPLQLFLVLHSVFISCSTFHLSQIISFLPVLYYSYHQEPVIGSCSVL